MKQRAAELLTDCLRAHGVDRLFCVPGESYLALLDALVEAPEIHLVTCRHESGAGFMALADAKITGRPGVVAVSRGPGASNAAIAIHLAEQDAVPLVVLVGQVARVERGRGAFQEVDYGKTFADMAKAVWEVNQADALPETVARAFHTACAGTPGPVVIALPEDLLAEPSTAAVVPPLPIATAAPAAADIDRAAALLTHAHRPLLIAGGQVGTTAGRQALQAAADACDIPVALTFKRQDLFDNTHPAYAGHLGYKIPRQQVELLQRADLILAVGTRLTDIATQGYTLPRAPVPEQPLIHVHTDGSRIGRVFRTELGLPCDPVAFLEQLAAQPIDRTPERLHWRDELHRYVREQAVWHTPTQQTGLDFGHFVHALSRSADDDAVVIMDSGNFSSWIHRYWPFRPTNLIIGAVGGAMGLGVPGAVAAGLRLAGKQVLSFVGDGGFLMTGGELATAVKEGIALKLIVCNNASYGTIRLHQERDFPRRTIGTDLVNPDFARLAEAFGATGITVAAVQDVEPAVRRLLACDGPAVVDVRTDIEAISAFTTIDTLRGRR